MSCGGFGDLPVDCRFAPGGWKIWLRGGVMWVLIWAWMLGVSMAVAVSEGDGVGAFSSGLFSVGLPELQMDQPVLDQPGPSQVSGQDYEATLKDYAARSLEILTIRARYKQRKSGYRSRSKNRLSKAVACEERFKRLSESHTMCQQDVGTDVPLSQAQKDAILKQHNQYRSRVSPSASNIQVMVWDDSLAQVAGKWGRQCRRGHDKADDRASPELPGVHVGQNAAYGHRSWQVALEAWHDEVKQFTFGEGAQSDGHVVGHYTQLVAWRSARVGCGQAHCPKSPYRRHYICNYAVGQMNSDPVTPYRQGDKCADCPDRCDKAGDMCDCGGKVCLNGGRIDLNTCECKCPEIYTGDVCQNLQCPAVDAWYCGTQWPKEYCGQFTNVPHECPYMCSVCTDQSSPATTMPSPKCRVRCKNGGKINPSDCTCVCSEGFTGAHCQRKVSGLCEGKTCLNGGRLNTRFCRCQCSFGHTGDRCETKVQVCGGKMCQNRGRLNTKSCECLCPRHYGGEVCQKKLSDADLCPEVLCQNGGHLEPSMCTCQCPDEFRSQRCEKRKCGQVTCHNGGKINFADCSCLCVDGFHGTRCKQKAAQHPNAVCDKSCGNGGLLDPIKCRCWCPAPYAGDFCQTVDCPEEDHEVCKNFPDTYCPGFFLMRHMCPFKCGLCVTKDCVPDKWFCNENYIQPHLCVAMGNYCPNYCGLC